MPTQKDFRLAPHPLLAPFDWQFRKCEEAAQCAVGVAFLRDDDGYLVAFTFGSTRDGVIDLVGFTIEWVGTDYAAVSRANELADRAVEYQDRAAAGLTSREIRTAAAHSGLLSEARRQVMEMFLPSVFREFKPRKLGREEAIDDRFLAQLVVDYAALLGEGRGARQRLADRYGHTDDNVRNWLTKAQQRGLWITAGRGRTEQPAPKAYDILRGSNA